MATIDFYYGTMGCGKSTYVLQQRYTLDREGFNPILMKPSQDTRDYGFVKSRIGISHQATLLKEEDDPCDFINHSVFFRPTHVLFDEAQFLSDKNIDGLINLVDKHDIQVYCFGLRTAYNGKLFDATARLMAIADNLIELPMIYKDGMKANMHIRMINGKPIFEGNPIFVGDIDEAYESVSRKEYFLKKEQSINAE